MIPLLLLYRQFVSSFSFLKQQNTCKNLISRADSLTLELSREEESNKLYSEAMRFAYFLNNYNGSKISVQVIAFTTINANLSSSL